MAASDAYPLPVGVTMQPAPKTKLMGRYIVTDPKNCHATATFRGTRVLLSHVLEQVANGVAWETIVEEWSRSVTKDAIREAVAIELHRPITGP